MTAITEQLSSALADRYRIEAHLGEGGMATVYLAHDVRHDRKVALKVLRPELAAVIGAERFLNEIRVTANLQHPHILPLHDSGEADSFLFYVMPYVEGDTLRDKLKREQQLDIDEAVEITRSVAAALDYAHRQGVIHRDIKPENILIHDGQPLVADFGIALAVSEASGKRLTETGLSIGTPHYMSPEQAMGDRELDARSDVYSVGAMLYEMLTGDPPYTGNSAQAIVAKVITEKAPPVTATRDTVPGHIAAAVAKALQKMPADRFKTAADFASALTNPAFALPATAAATTFHVAPSAPSSARIRTVLLIAALALAVVLGAIGWLRSPPAPAIARLDLDLGGIVLPDNEDIAISPDGSMLAVSGTRGGELAIYLRRLGEADFNKVPGTENGMRPAFSPDGAWLVFRDNANETLAKVAVAGGGLLRLVDGLRPYNPHWGEDGTIVFSGPTGNHVLPADGGAPKRIAIGGRRPHMLPDGSGVLGNFAGAIHYLDLAADSSREIISDGNHPMYVETGHILFVPSSGGLFAVPFDLGRHRVTGPPVPVLDRVSARIGRRGYSVSRHGTLVHIEGEGLGGGAGELRRFLIVDRLGTVDTVRHPTGYVSDPQVSPDGSTIAYEFREAGAVGTDIYTYHLLTGTNPQITFEGTNDQPQWSPDGTRLLFASNRAGDHDLYVKPADNSSSAERVLAKPGDQQPNHWFRQDTILFESVDDRSPDLWILTRSRDNEAEPYLQAPWAEFDGRVSPDGNLVAYGSNETVESEIWLQDFPVPAGKRRVSFRGGGGPLWSPDGRTLYYWQPGGLDSLFAVRIEREPTVVVRQPEFVLALDASGLNNWDVFPDGDRFIVTVPEGVSQPGIAPDAVAETRYLIVLNWFEELQARVGN